RVALEAAGHRFITETDTETLAHLIEDAAGDTLEERVIAALAHVEGTYGLAVMSTDEPGKIVVARRGSPVLLGIGEEELFVASDASAVLEHTRSVVYLDDGDIAVLTADGYHVVDAESHVQLREVDDVAWDLAEIELGGYPHFMLKEISEQAETVRATLRGHDLPGLVGAHDGEAVGALHMRQRGDHALLEGIAGGVLDQVGQCFGVGLRDEPMPRGLERDAQRVGVFHDAVVHQRHSGVAVAVRVRVALGGNPVGGPARVRDAARAVHRLAL